MQGLKPGSSFFYKGPIYVKISNILHNNRVSVAMYSLFY